LVSSYSPQTPKPHDKAVLMGVIENLRIFSDLCNLKLNIYRFIKTPVLTTMTCSYINLSMSFHQYLPGLLLSLQDT